MRVIVAGGRDFTDQRRAFDCLDRFHAHWPIAVLISGMARGADTIGCEWARSRGVRLLPMPADWDAHGRSAGFIRNEQMAEVGNYLLAFWDGRSHGTKHMIDIAQRKNITTTIVRY